jgi:hypothetical protein
MKKLFLSFAFCTATLSVFSQNCTPEWPAGAGPGIMPDSATNLPAAHETLPYTAVVQFKVPLDTSATYLGTEIDVTVIDVTVDSVKGFDIIPASSPFTYVTNPGTGVFPGNSLGCVQITGTPGPGSAGVYPIQVYVTAHAHPSFSTSIVIPQSSVIDFYHIVVDTNLTASFVDMRDNGMSAFPSVTASSVELSYFSRATSEATVTAVNALGQTVVTRNESVQAGNNKTTFDMSSLANGSYIVTLRTSEKLFTTKVVLNK